MKLNVSRWDKRYHYVKIIYHYATIYITMEQNKSLRSKNISLWNKINHYAIKIYHYGTKYTKNYRTKYITTEQNISQQNKICDRFISY